MSQREQFLAYAREQIGYTEGANNQNKFGLFFSANKVAWCAYFVSWCARQANIPTSIIPSSGYVPGVVYWYRNKGLFYKRSVYTPKAGDLIIFDFNHNSTGDHIGIVTQVSGGYVYTIEGNTSEQGENDNGDGVWNKARPLSYTGILGYCTPQYADDELEDDGMVYNEIKEVPPWGKDTILKLIKMGALKGNENGLDLTESMLRIFVVHDRMGLYD